MSDDSQTPLQVYAAEHGFTVEQVFLDAYRVVCRSMGEVEEKEARKDFGWYEEYGFVPYYVSEFLSRHQQV